MRLFDSSVGPGPQVTRLRDRIINRTMHRDAQGRRRKITGLSLMSQTSVEDTIAPGHGTALPDGRQILHQLA